MIAIPSSCHLRSLSNNGLCLHFTARIPDSAHWFMGTLQRCSLLVELTDQIVWWRAGCGRLDFAPGFDANPPLGGFEVQICSKVFWVTLWMWFSPSHGVDWSCNKVRANGVNARNLTNHSVVKAPVAGFLRVQQLWWRQ